MEENHPLLAPQLRRFIYRSAQPDTEHPHPLRRRTDIALASPAIKHPLCPQPLLFRMCLCVRLD